MGGAGGGRPRTAEPTQPSPELLDLAGSVAALAGRDLGVLTGLQVLTDTGALLGQMQKLEMVRLAHLAAIERDQLYRLADARSTGGWLEANRLAADRGQVGLAKRMDAYPRIAGQVLAGSLTMATAQRLQASLSSLKAFLDRPDGLIDGQDGEQALFGVIVHIVLGQVCQGRGGFAAQDDPQLLALLHRLQAIYHGHLDADSPTPSDSPSDSAGDNPGDGGAVERGQLARLEAALLVLAEQLAPALLPAALGELVDALLPAQLERRGRHGEDEANLKLTKNYDGTGWQLTGELSLQCGERLHTVLPSELRRDPVTPVDTTAAAALRERGIDPYDPDGTALLGTPRHPDPSLDSQPGDALGDALGGCAVPRSRGQRLHDALDLALGAATSAPASAATTTSNPFRSTCWSAPRPLEGQPDATPARGGSGATLPAGLVRRWACGGALTRLVMTLAGKVLEVSHTERTLKASERRALYAQTGGVCQAAGCRCSASDLGAVLHPHHVDPWARTGSTSLTSTILLCELNHADLHASRTITLKNGRRLDANSWLE